VTTVGYPSDSLASFFIVSVCQSVCLSVYHYTVAILFALRVANRPKHHHTI